MCCCKTRQSINIYLIVSSSLYLIYGIYVIILLPSKTGIYKSFKQELEIIIDGINRHNSYHSSDRNLNMIKPIKATYLKINRNMEEDINDMDYNSYIQLLNISYKDVEKYPHDIILNLKSIEGIEITSFVFVIIFLIIQIIFLVFSCGIKQYQVLSSNIFNIFKIIKFVCIILSSIFIALSLIYGILLHVSLFQYGDFIQNTDQCDFGITMGILFGYSGVGYYITLLICFIYERKIFLEVGTSENPGPQAQYDINGNKILNNIVVLPNQVYQQQTLPEINTIEVQQRTNQNQKKDSYHQNQPIQIIDSKRQLNEENEEKKNEGV